MIEALTATFSEISIIEASGFYWIVSMLLMCLCSVVVLQLCFFLFFTFVSLSFESLTYLQTSRSKSIDLAETDRTAQSALIAKLQDNISDRLAH